jgi:probable F420-dependent oxidoreductase
MYLSANLPSAGLQDVPDLARKAEAVGFDTLWSSETQHAPFLPLALVAANSTALRFGTAVAIAFARSPATLAYTAWDLAQASGGRFILGLGTQVKAHVERRFGMPWPESVIQRLREQIQAIRALWNSWQTGERLNFRGQEFKLTLMTPFFNPGPIEHPRIPIYIAGVNTGLCSLAGEIADGFHVHPYHSARYLREVIRPAIAAGAAREGRDPREVSLSITAMAATDQTERDFIRSQIAFYGSTPSYRPVMEIHGWGEAADRLRALSRRGRWDEMPSLISDEMLETYAVAAGPTELAGALKARYGGLADHLTLYFPYVPGERDEFWRRLLGELREAG